MVANRCHACGSLLPPPDSRPWLCRYCGAPQETPEVGEDCVAMNDTAIVAYLRPLLTGIYSTWVHPTIPEKKVANVRKAQGPHLPPQETILALYDGTAFGSASDGFILTSKRLAWKNQLEDPHFLEWSHVDEDEVYVEEDKIVVGRARLDTLYSDDDESLYTWVEAIQTLARSARPPEERRRGASVSGASGGVPQAGWGGPAIAVGAAGRGLGRADGGWGGMHGGAGMGTSGGPPPPEVERLPRPPYSVDVGCAIVDVHPSGEIVLAAGADKIELRRAANGQRVRAFAAPDTVLCAKFSPDGQWLLVGTLDGRVLLYDARKGALRGATPKMDDGCDEVAWLGRSTWFAAAGQRGELWLVDATNMQPATKILGPDPDYASMGGLAVTPDGTRLFVSIGERIGAFDTSTGKIVWRNDAALQNASRLAVSPRGDLLVAAGYDGVAVFNAVNGQAGARMQFSCARNVSWPERSGGFLERKQEDELLLSWSPRPRFSPHGDLVATQDHVGNLCFLDVSAALTAVSDATGALHPTARDVGRGWIEDLAWFQDGNHVLLGMSDDTIAVWRVRPMAGVMRSTAIEPDR